jgi:N-acyl-D-aspartate/D-glutamate deacylase
LYATHTRNKEARAVEAVEEGIRAALASGARLQVSHIIPRRGGPADALERCVAAVEGARDAGVNAAFDIHTRLFGLTNLSALLPPTAMDRGVEALRSNLQDPRARAELKAYQSLITSFLLGGPERVYLLDTPRCPEVRGKSLAELIPPGGDAYDVLFDVLLTELEELHRPQIICWSYDESQLTAAAQRPQCMVGSDATTMAPDGPLAATTFHGAYTWAAWFFRRCVREQGALRLEEAVRKLTSLPATHVGLVDRGVLKPGGWADLAVFDAQRFGERGTVEQPNQLAEGMVHVIVNGQIALQDGQFTSERSGRVLRRGVAE